eukprot:jgi/Tetstr1/445416/TSEL_033199.t1
MDSQTRKVPLKVHEAEDETSPDKSPSPAKESSPPARRHRNTRDRTPAPHAVDFTTAEDTDEHLFSRRGLTVALTAPIALLRAIRLCTIRFVVYLTESEFDPSELLIHPFSQTIREAGELGGNTGHNQIRRAAQGLRKKARKTPPASLVPRAAGRPIYTLTLQLTAHHHSIIGGTSSTDRTELWRKTVSTTCRKINAAPAPAPTERSKPRLSGTRGSDNEWETDEDMPLPSASSHQ